MALSAAAGTFNAAADTFWAAWLTYLDTLSGDTDVYVAFPNQIPNTLGSPDVGDTNSFPQFDPDQGVDIIHFQDLTDKYPHQVNGKQLFWKLTNAAGDTST